MLLEKEGTCRSLFFLKKLFIMNIEKYVTELVRDKISDREDLFLVSVQYVPNAKLSILVDGDNGLNIQDCAAISRHVGFHLEEENIIEAAYNIEVSSPGIESPLVLDRQFMKNIGREVSVKLTNGEKHEGVLLSYTPEGIVINESIKEKGKKAIQQENFFNIDNIVETKVLISFK
ncbi:ribosome maturation factor RimP [Albibacterium bauzanense]|uniref:Ribosome maturation factor RimP n=2 Tax=Albibacterium bauzanense TaxID=653929 RepID=A0A4R1LUR3_9SPHI|nr:ribosome maturation factor RimP [Albibacterium bauzanense]